MYGSPRHRPSACHYPSRFRLVGTFGSTIIRQPRIPSNQCPRDCLEPQFESTLLWWLLVRLYFRCTEILWAFHDAFPAPSPPQMVLIWKISTSRLLVISMARFHLAIITNEGHWVCWLWYRHAVKFWHPFQISASRSPRLWRLATLSLAWVMAPYY